MTVIIGSYGSFEIRLLTAAYYTSNILDKDVVTIKEIQSCFLFDMNSRFLRTALKTFSDRGLNKYNMTFDDFEDQKIWLSADGLKSAEQLIENNDTDIREFRRQPVDETSAPIDVDSTSWTGLPKSGVLSESSAQRLKMALRKVEDSVVQSGLSNTEKSQAQAYITAIVALSDAPEPPAELIYKILMVVASLSAVGSFFTDVIQLFS